MKNYLNKGFAVRSMAFLGMLTFLFSSCALEKRHYRKGFFVHRNKTFHTEDSPDTARHFSKKTVHCTMSETKKQTSPVDTVPRKTQPARVYTAVERFPPPKKRVTQVTTTVLVASANSINHRIYPHYQTNVYTRVKEISPEQQNKNLKILTWIGFSLVVLTVVILIVSAFITIPGTGFTLSYVMLGSWLGGLIISVITTRKTKKYGKPEWHWLAVAGLIACLVIFAIMVTALLLILL